MKRNMHYQGKNSIGEISFQKLIPPSCPFEKHFFLCSTFTSGTSLVLNTQGQKAFSNSMINEN